MNQPKNETETHYILKEIGKYVLWNWGFTRVATEVNGMYSCEDIVRAKNRDLKSVIDVVGIKTIRLGKHYNDPMGYDMRGIEAKASYSDYKNGFCVAPKNTYVIAPKSIIPIKELPDKIGLIEVDFDKLSINRLTQMNKISLDGIQVVVKAKRRLDSRFNDEDHYQKFCLHTLERIAYQNTRELLFWRNVIEVKK